MPPDPLWPRSTRSRSRPRQVASLYRAHFEYVWQVLRKLGVDPASAEDATHDVFLVVHRRWDDFAGGVAVRTWLFAIARRIASRYRRTQFRSERRRAVLALVQPAEPDSPDVVLARKEAWTQLLSFLGGLDEVHREAFILGELRGVSRTQMGRVLGINPNTAYSRLLAARRRFHATFADPAERRAVRDAKASLPPESKQRVWALLVGGFRTGAAPTSMLPAWSKAVGLFGLTGGGVLFALLGAPSGPAELRAGIDPEPEVGRRSSDGSRGAQSGATQAPGDTEPTLSGARAPVRAKVGTVRRAPTVRRPSNADVLATAAQGSEPGSQHPADIVPAMAALADARDALRVGRSELALELVERSRALDPDHAFATEQLVTRVWALCAAHREVDARREVRALLRRPASAAYVQVLHDSCVADLITSPPRGEQPG